MGPQQPPAASPTQPLAFPAHRLADLGLLSKVEELKVLSQVGGRGGRGLQVGVD
jgi:hypothetical protein